MNIKKGNGRLELCPDSSGGSSRLGKLANAKLPDEAINLGQLQNETESLNLDNLTTKTTASVGTVLDVGTNQTFAKEVNHTIIVSASTTANTGGGNLTINSGDGVGTGDGGTLLVSAGTSGAGATGNGGRVLINGANAASTDGNGGDVILTPGNKAGSGLDGDIFLRGVVMIKQGAPAAKTVSATLTAAEVLTGIITVNQGGGGASAQQLPTAAAMDTALPTSAAGDAFDFSVINISVVAAEDASLTTNAGWTLVGSMDVESDDNDRAASSARFRARKTGTGAWTLYRLS